MEMSVSIIEARRHLRFVVKLLVLLAPGFIPGLHAQAKGPEATLLGRDLQGEVVHGYTLSNKAGMTAKVMDLGAAVLEINVPGQGGTFANVVLEAKELNTYETKSPINAIVGRYANRILDGFTVDGHHFELTHDDNGVTLHGGIKPYSARLWLVVPSPTRNSVTFELRSPDGDQGFPGNLSLRVTYSLSERNEFRIDYFATTDKKTVLNPTNHIYFNLAGNGHGDILAQQLQLSARKFTPVNAIGIPSGDLQPVEGTALDFSKLTAIGARMKLETASDLSVVRGYDYNFVLDPESTGLGHVAAKLYDPGSRRMLEVETTEPGLQVFSGGGLRPRTPLAGDGAMAVKNGAVALETQHFPDSPNHPDFPTTELMPGKQFHSATIFRFLLAK